jgi:Tfp pilus assembly major pilin PilA
MKRNLLLLSLILLSTTLLCAKNPVNSFKDLQKGKKDEAFKSFLEISKKDSTSVIVNYALALLYSDSNFSQYDLELSHKYSKNAKKHVDYNPNSNQNIYYSWNDLVNKSELKQLEKLKLEPKRISLLKDSILISIFNLALKKNTISGYNHFINYYPEYFDINFVHELINDLAFKDATKKNTIEDYKYFINNYPNSTKIYAANQRIDEILFSQVKEKNTIEAFNQFIKDYPNSKQINNAKQMIYELAFKEAKQKNTIDDYELFISKYPESKEFIDEAKRKIVDLTHIDKIYTNSDINSFKKNGLKGIAQMASFLNDKFDILTEIQKDSVYVTFLNTYHEIIKEANKESSMDYSIIEVIKKLDNGSDLRDEQIKKANNEISEYGVEMQVYTMNEDCYYIAKDNYVYNLFIGRISSAMDDYLGHEKWFREKCSEFVMHPYFYKDDVYKECTYWEDFIKKYPDFFFIAEAKESYSNWLSDLFNGFPYDPVFDNETHVLSAYRKSFYEKIIKKNDLRQSTIKISRYYNELKKNNFKDPEWNANNASENNFSDANVEKKAKYILKSFTKYTAFVEDENNLYQIEISHAEMDEANSQDKLILSGKMSHYIKYKSSNNTPMGQIISMATGNAQIVASEKVTFYCPKSELAKDWSILDCEGYFSYTKIKVNIDWSKTIMHTRLIVSGNDYALKLR